MRAGRVILVGIALASSVLAFVLTSFFLSQGSCSRGTFRCGNATTCIPQKYMCNGRADCPNGEDESAKTCADFHGSDFARTLLKGARNLSADYRTCSLANVPPVCQCRSRTYVYCKNQMLTRVPAGVSENVTRLIMANNSISFPEENAFESYRQLHLIHLEGNGIERLPPRIFRNQRKLVKLLLMNNHLRSLDERLFQGLDSLGILFVHNNFLADADLVALERTKSLQMLDLSGNLLRLARGFPTLPQLMDLMLDDNRIEDVRDDTFAGLPAVQFLGLRNNRIKYIERDAFRRNPHLKELDLSYNYLSTLPDSVFSSLIHLTKLFIGNNPFYRIPSHLFVNLRELSSLGLEEIEIDNIDVDMFSAMTNLEFVYLKKFYYCTFVPTVPKCEPKTDGVSTVDNLLGKPVLRVTVWIVASATCLGNMYVFWERLTTRDENKVLSWIVRNLAVSDFIMGIYLVVIGSKDMEYRGIYQQVSHEWISSWTCTVVGVLAMISSEVSIFILVFMSFERFMLIAVPFGGHQNLSPRTSLYSLWVIWTFGVSVAVVPVIHWRNSTRFYGANGMCFPLHLDDPYFAGWQFSAFVFVGINLSGLLLIAILYTGMFWSIWRTRRATTLSMGDFEFAIRFFFIVLTNTVCWAPIIALKLLAFFRLYISADAYSWVSVFVMPVNSAFNPLLYTLTTPRYREMIKHNIARRMQPFGATKKNSAGDTTCSHSSGMRNATPCLASLRSASSKQNSFDMPTFNTSADRSSSTGCDDGGSTGTGRNSRGNSLDLPASSDGDCGHGDAKGRAA